MQREQRERAPSPRRYDKEEILQGIRQNQEQLEELKRQNMLYVIENFELRRLLQDSNFEKLIDESQTHLLNQSEQQTIGLTELRHKAIQMEENLKIYRIFLSVLRGIETDEIRSLPELAEYLKT